MKGKTMAGKCEHGLTLAECFTCASPKYVYAAPQPAPACPLCGEGQVTGHHEDVAQKYGGHESMVPMYFRSCLHCGSDFAGAEESLLNKRAMMGFRKRVDGLKGKQ
jgi:hypothetical protein